MTDTKKESHRISQQKYRDKNQTKLNASRKKNRADNKAISNIKNKIPDIEVLKAIKPVKQLPKIIIFVFLCRSALKRE